MRNIQNVTFCFVLGAHYVDFTTNGTNDARYDLPLKKYAFPPNAGKLNEVNKKVLWCNFGQSREK